MGNAATTIEEIPSDGAAGGDFLVVPYEVDLGPEVAVEAVDVLAAEVDGAGGEPVGRQEPHGDTHGAAGPGVEEVGGAVGPLNVVERVAGELVPDDVEVAAPGPVVVEVDQLQPAAALGEVCENYGMELLRPRRRHRGRGAGTCHIGRKVGYSGEEEEEREHHEGRRRRRHRRLLRLTRASRVLCPWRGRQPVQ